MHVAGAATVISGTLRDNAVRGGPVSTPTTRLARHATDPGSLPLVCHRKSTVGHDAVVGNPIPVHDTVTHYVTMRRTRVRNHLDPAIVVAKLALAVPVGAGCDCVTCGLEVSVVSGSGGWWWAAMAP